jgi:hypothetical protein
MCVVVGGEFTFLEEGLILRKILRKQYIWLAGAEDSI